MNLIFDGIEYIDEDECYAELSFSAEAIIKVKYSYIDHSEETYDPSVTFSINADIFR